jgi:hypothetical protein
MVELHQCNSVLEMEQAVVINHEGGRGWGKVVPYLC